MKVKVGINPERTQFISKNMQPQSNRYGLKQCVTRTIHIGMGHVINKMTKEF